MRMRSSFTKREAIAWMERRPPSEMISGVARAIDQVY